MQNLLFLTFFLSRGGSLRALMMREAAEGTTEMAACLFWMVRHTVILRPFQSDVALAMSSPTFLGDCKGRRNYNKVTQIHILERYVPVVTPNMHYQAHFGIIYWAYYCL